MPEATSVRTRTVQWQDPAAFAARAVDMTGLQQLQAVQRGELPPPPMALLLDMRSVDFGDGFAVLAVHPQEFHANGAGGTHGGLVGSLLDSAMWLAVHTTMPTRSFCSTLQLNVHYVRPLVIGAGEVSCRGEVVHRGRRTATAQGVIRDASGRVLAHGSTSCLVQSAPSA